MRGTTFQKPLEFNLVIEGESWPQGAQIGGRLSIKNHGPEALALDGFGVAVVQGDLKKVKASAADRFKAIDKTTLNNSSLAAGGETHLDWNFTLPENCPITDKGQSLFVTYGGLADIQFGYLQLSVQPRPLFLKFIEILDVFYRFKQKDRKMGKKGVEFKLVPPESKDFKALDGLILMMKTEGENLHMQYTFKIKKIGMVAGTMSVDKREFSVSQTLTPSDYMMGKGMPDQDKIKRYLESALDEAKKQSAY
jgi:hypothetical protein